MAIAYKASGAGVGSQTAGVNLEPACPATVDADDILVAHVYVRAQAAGAPTFVPATPSGWSLVDPSAPRILTGPTNPPEIYAYARLADGSEDGATVDFGDSGGANTDNRFARIHSFSGYVSGALADVIPPEHFTHTVNATDPAMPTVASTMAGGLCVALIHQTDDNAQASATGESGGDWTEAVAEYLSNTLATDVGMGLQTCTPTNDPGTVSGGTVATADDPAGVLGFCIRPTADAQAYPTDAARAVTDTGGSNDTTPSFNVPAGVQAGELLMLAWRAGGNVIAITDAAGFTQLVLSTADGTDDDFYVGYKIATGTEGATITFTVSNGRRFAGVMWRIQDGGTPTISSVATGSGTSVNPPAHDPAGGPVPSLWIALGGCEDARTVSDGPTNYANTAFENASTGADGATCMGATRQLNTDVENPSAFTLTVSSNAHMTATVQIPYEADAVFIPTTVVY